MGYRVSYEQADGLLKTWQEQYRVYAPKRFAGRGWRPGTDMIRYGEIQSLRDVAYTEQSHFSPKDVVAPIMQTMLSFTADEVKVSSIDDKGILLLARPCDIHGIQRLDKIFLENGGQADFYYQRYREKIKIIMIECREGWEHCFCVSMGANRTDAYSMAVRFDPDGLLFEVRDEDFVDSFAGLPTVDFTPEFVSQDKNPVQLPVITGLEQLKAAYDLPMWAEYDDQCISCGSCNTVCTTCSCFDTIDVIFSETSRDGERRRVWSSCMLESFSTMAGGHAVRKTPGERMRFKVLHKVHDYRARFGGDEHMCIGCGRCDIRCPEDISFIDAVNRLSAAMADQASVAADTKEGN